MSSILQFLPLLIIALGIYGVYQLAKRRAPATAGAPGPIGVGGWLLLLVAGLMIFGPLVGAGRLNADFMSSESQYPNLVTLDKWRTFKSVTWLTYLCFAALSFYAGWGLARGHDVSVVRRAKTILWLIGPTASIIMGMFIPLLVFGKPVLDPHFIGGLMGSALGAAIWTAYLSRSKRVRATYTSSSSDREGF